MTRDNDAKVRENLIRRMAERQGLKLARSRRRDTRALDYGKYVLINPRADSVIVFGLIAEQFGATLDEVEEYLTAPKTTAATGGGGPSISPSKASTVQVRSSYPGGE